MKRKTRPDLHVPPLGTPWPSIFIAGQEKPKIVKSAEEAQVRASASVLFNLRLMVNDPAFSDVVFLCNDGKRVQASRILLAGRSEVLKSMFMNGMAESNLSEIKMAEISSPVLLAVFEFLYTGTVIKFEPEGWEIACGVITASRYFLLPDLEMITHKFMHNLTMAVVDDLPEAATMLTAAVALKSLSDKTDASLNELVTILSSNWSDSLYVKSLSEEAFDYILKNSRGNCEEDGKLSFTEYLRFRQVIRWWSYQTDFGSCAAEELLTFIEKEALSICANIDVFERVESPREDATCILHDWHCWRVDKASRNSAIRLMSNIDCRRSHPILVAKVVEPLKVVSGEEILNAFRFHAIRRLIICVSKCCWAHGESYCTLDNGSILQKTQDGDGLAVMTAGMSRVNGVYQWRFVLEQTEINDVVQLGFMYQKSIKGELDGESLSARDDARLIEISEGQVSVNKENRRHFDWTVLRSHFNYSERTTVGFKYDALEHTCSVSIDEQDFGICWERLPDEAYYPAVSLGFAFRRHVRIELGSGFDIL